MASGMFHGELEEKGQSAASRVAPPAAVPLLDALELELDVSVLLELTLLAPPVLDPELLDVAPTLPELAVAALV